MLGWFSDVASPGLGKFLGRWPTLAHVRRARPATLRKFWHEHSRSREEDLERRLMEMQRAVEATSDPALLEAGVLAIGQLIRLIAELRQTIAELDGKIREIAATHPDFHIVQSFPGAGVAMAPRLLAALGTQRDRFDSASALQCYSGIAPVVSRSGLQEWVHWRWACPKFIRQTFQEWAQHSMKKCVWARQYYQQQKREKSHHAAVRALAFKWIRILYRCWKDRRPYDEPLLLAALQKRKPVASNHAVTQPQAAPVDIQWKNVAGFSKLEAVSS